jgi:hypothetical protein
VQLLALIQSLSTSWATMNPEFAALAGDVSRAERRRAVVQAVARVVGGGDGGACAGGGPFPIRRAKT